MSEQCEGCRSVTAHAPPIDLAIDRCGEIGYSGFEVQEYGKDIGIPVLDGASKFLRGTLYRRGI